MLKKITVNSLVTAITSTTKRFPTLVVLSILIYIGIIYRINIYGVFPDVLFYFIFICCICFLQTLALDLMFEKLELDRFKWIHRFLVLILNFGYFCYIKSQIEVAFYNADIFRNSIIILLFFSLLLVMVSPFFKKGNQLAFWRYNLSLFSRLFTTILFAAIMLIAVLIILSSIRYLFDFSRFETEFFYIIYFILSIFCPLFFIAGIPENFDQFERDNYFPKVLKILIQYIFIPIVIIYALILLVYDLKILIQWELPKGLLSYMTLGLSACGILVYMAIYPIVNLKENNFLRLYKRVFFIVMIPLLLFLWIGVIKRVSDYGITESRYFLLLGSLVFTFLVFYFNFSKTKNIKIVISLLLIASVVALFSSSSISLYSQKQRLDRYIKVRDANEVSNIISYIRNHHSGKVLDGVLLRYTDKDLSGLNENKISEILTNSSVTKPTDISNYFFTEYAYIDVSDYDFTIINSDDKLRKDINKQELIVDKFNSVIYITWNNINYKLDMLAFGTELMKFNSEEERSKNMLWTSDDAKVRILFTSISYENIDEFKFRYSKEYILLK